MKFTCFIDRVVHVPLDGREFGEIGLNDFGGLCARDAEVLCQSESRAAVQDTEVHFLCLAPHVGIDLVDRNLEDAGGCSRMDGASGSKRFNQRSSARKGCGDGQCELHIMGGNEEMVIATCC